MNASGVPNTCKSSDEVSFGRHISGELVSNTWATYPEDGDNPWKQGLIPDMLDSSFCRVKLRCFGMGPRSIS
jgi:hypothetical protein